VSVRSKAPHVRRSRLRATPPGPQWRNRDREARLAARPLPARSIERVRACVRARGVRRAPPASVRGWHMRSLSRSLSRVVSFVRLRERRLAEGARLIQLAAPPELNAERPRRRRPLLWRQARCEQQPCGRDCLSGPPSLRVPLPVRGSKGFDDDLERRVRSKGTEAGELLRREHEDAVDSPQE
jgi:hypothetical protein